MPRPPSYRAALPAMCCATCEHAGYLAGRVSRSAMLCFHGDAVVSSRRPNSAPEVPTVRIATALGGTPAIGELMFWGSCYRKDSGILDSHGVDPAAV